MEWVNWICDYVLDYYRWFTNRSMKVVFLGLDCAGKTTLLHIMKYGSLHQCYPTRKPTMEEVVMSNVTLKAFDLGGNSGERVLWKDYIVAVDAIVFIVDAADNERLDEASKVLGSTLRQEEVAKKPVLIFGNKIDRPTAVSEQQLRDTLNLSAFPEINMHLQMCSIMKRVGLKQGFDWLIQNCK
eukprot:TRINITY_DN8276_c1_g1_i1.p1 TRINITY_DN8276_c1_g1~~TRINITY_DN8276_c1_g1_i1.p1  ORF type:complete len:184 (-),score=16.94 TRINITY_DN8276_c1_g1_i1:69-620(-)